VGYGAKGLHALGLPISPEVTMAVSIPIVLLLGLAGLRKVHRIVSEH
jgi:uncharacterized membrane-anchored protein